MVSWRKSRLRGWHESCAVLPVFPPPLPTPLSSRRCGFDGVLGAPPSQPEVGEQPGALPRAAPEQAWRENLPGEGRAVRAARGAGGSGGGCPPHTPHSCLSPLCCPAAGSDRSRFSPSAMPRLRLFDPLSRRSCLLGSSGEGLCVCARSGRKGRVKPTCRIISQFNQSPPFRGRGELPEQLRAASRSTGASFCTPFRVVRADVLPPVTPQVALPASYTAPVTHGSPSP